MAAELKIKSVIGFNGEYFYSNCFILTHEDLLIFKQEKFTMHCIILHVEVILFTRWVLLLF
jgi:hypothetical protein